MSAAINASARLLPPRPAAPAARLGGFVLALLLSGAGLAAADPASDSSSAAITVYHVGNSLTGDLWGPFSKTLTDLQKKLGHTYDWQAHYRGATSQSYMFKNPEGPGTQSIGMLGGHVWRNVGAEGFVPWPKALPGHHWDFVTLQPWNDDSRATLASEVAAINGMIAAAKSRPDNATTRFAIYATWAGAPYDNLNGFRDDFTRPTPNLPDQPSVATRAFFRHVTDEVRRTHPAVVMIPAGEVFLALDEQMQAGKFEEFTSIRQLHRDVIHLNSAGCNVVAWTAYAVLFQKSPVGLPNYQTSGPDYPPYKSISDISPADQKHMQEVIWETVTSPDLRGYTGVQPSPGAAR